MARDTIFPDQARIISHDGHAEGQYIMRLHAPLVAEHALPGCFIHMQCDPEILMRRPMSIMHADSNAGWIDILYKAHGEGTIQLSKRKVGDIVDLLGPIGTPFKLKDYRKRPLLIGGGVGIPPMIFLAEHIKNTSADIQPFVIMGSEIPFPFKSRPSQFMVPGIPEGVIAAMPLLEDWGIPSRLTSLQGYVGCFEGYVTDLAQHWLDTLDKEHITEVEIFCCGPTPM
ncbi:MAG: dihydroorotate dehydrogenase electron transfer subunit, partial [Gammaproteobacteria bacterium]